jgi:rhodanese-related sulfurtransferase
MFLLSLSVFWVVNVASDEPDQRIVVTSEELITVLTETKYTEKVSENMLIIDLRDKEDYIKGHIENSINIPYDDDGQILLSYLDKHDGLSKDIYLMCYSGKRSGKAFNQLVENNYKQVNYIRFGYEEFHNVAFDQAYFIAGKCKCEDEE